MWHQGTDHARLKAAFYEFLLALKFYLFLFFYFLRKISPELSATNPPPFAEEDWPGANIRAHLRLLYMWDAYHSMACQAVPCPHPGSKTANAGPLKWNMQT